MAGPQSQSAQMAGRYSGDGVDLKNNHLRVTIGEMIEHDFFSMPLLFKFGCLSLFIPDLVISEYIYFSPCTGKLSKTEQR